MPTLDGTLVIEPVTAGKTLAATQTLLSVSPVLEDQAALSGILADLNWTCQPAATCRDAFQSLKVCAFRAILCEETLEDGTWKDVLNQAAGIPLIVTSRQADAYLWSVVLNLGVYDVLSKPFGRREVAHVLTTIALRCAAKTRQNDRHHAKPVKACGPAPSFSRASQSGFATPSPAANE